MANLVLRPDSVGFYSGWSTAPAAPHWSNINDADSNGDGTYVFTDVEDSAFTTGYTNTSPLSFPRPTRIPSIVVVATVRGVSVTPTTFKFRLRYLGVNYDSEEFTVASSTYIEKYKKYDVLPDGNPWSSLKLNEIEVGLVYGSGIELRCSKLEIQVQTETYPHWRLNPDGEGFHADWTAAPGTGPTYLHVAGQFDGNSSYVSADTVGDTYTTALSDTGIISPTTIDRVQASVLVRNVDDTDSTTCKVVVRSGGTTFDGATSTTGHTLPANSDWVRLTEEFITEPSSGWPSGNPAATDWGKATVDALEIGARVGVTGPEIRATNYLLEVWLENSPITSIDSFPSANGFHTGLAPIVPNGGESAWEDVDEDPPDDATTYVGANADTAGTPQYGTFSITSLGGLPAGEKIANVELRLRVRLGGTSTTTIAPVVRSGGDTYIGKPVFIEGTGTTWFDVKEDFGTNPDSGSPWTDTAVDAAEWGMVVLEGECFLSRVRVQAHTATDFVGTTGASEFQLTDEADFYINRSVGDGTILAPLEFGVGTGGFLPADPKTASAVVKADTALFDEIARFPITQVTVDFTSTPQSVYYWCRVPQDVAVDKIGEVGLYATIIWSPIPAEIGYEFLYGIMHMPCQVRHTDSVHLYVLRVDYP